MSAPQREAMVSDICNNYLFDADVRQIFAETSSKNVFLWMCPPPSAPVAATATTDSTSSASSSPAAAALNSVEISDPETAYALHESRSYPVSVYCRAPPMLEQHLVGSLLRATGLGGGHYHPPRADAVTLGGAGTTLGRGEVELFIGAANAGNNAALASSSTSTRNGKNGSANNDDQASGDKKHTTGWHTDFQENFTIEQSGVKR